MLATRAKGSSLDGLSVWKSSLIGLAVGSLFPAVSSLLTGGLLFPFELVALTWSGAVFGVLGGGITGGLVAVAKHQASIELSEGDPTIALPQSAEASSLPPTTL